MSQKLICPLKTNSTNNECTSDCAWYTGSEVNPQCAITRISFDLSTLMEEKDS